MEARLQSKIWIDAHIRSCFASDMPAFIVSRGDSERGLILLKVNQFEKGVLVFEQATDFDGRRVWRNLGSFSAADERDADALISKKRGFDPDIWVLEVEDMKGVYELDAPISDF